MLRALGRSGIRPVDGWLALGFVAAAAAEAVIRYHDQHALLISNLVGALTFSCLALRRSHPLLTVSVTTVLGSVGSVVQAAIWPHGSGDQVVPIFALLVVSYSLGAYASRRQLMWGAWQPMLLVLVVDLAEPSTDSLISAALFITIFISAAPILAGRFVRGRSTLVRRLRDQAAEIDAQHGAELGAAVAGERLRMAHRFHETLVTGMQSLATDLTTIEASAGEPEIVRIERAARELLSQTRQEVVALAAPIPADDSPPRPPRPLAFGDAAQPWTVLAGGALCTGLMIESRTLALHVPMPVAWLACVGLAVPLALAWVRPLLMIGALWVVAALFAGLVAPLHGSFTAIGLAFVPPFVVASLEPRRRALVGLVVCCVGELVCFGRAGLAGHAAIALCCWIAGAVFHERADLVEQLRSNNTVLDEQQAAASRHAVAAERLRVARELHDAVGHSLTVIVLQAGAARRICTSDPARAQTVLSTIAEVASDGLAELRGGASPRDPGDVADLRSVANLLETARATGLRIDAHVEDVTARLAPEAQFAVYRVVQESLTNVLKHAPGASAEVTIQISGGEVDILIANSAPGSRATLSPSGHGLHGMRARVEACGGRISWSPRADGGFEVRARLPAELALL